MKKLSSSAITASVLAASTAALFSNFNSYLQLNQELRGRNGWEIGSEKEKFAPRFDGLRFIETLVTAHK
ncbi:hypothetical protein L1987_05158 [Smallanthus sonchifolius]|uniref:Uncharacterized protein n=1 Tax=Smallanthus sonchifolius TaxID=185202 RepID=A0ACB9JUQ3_9ASTR|nr:hypothetical protein L1987_05158 [Smallanthus sonchifolius]